MVTYYFIKSIFERKNKYTDSVLAKYVDHKVVGIFFSSNAWNIENVADSAKTLLNWYHSPIHPNFLEDDMLNSRNGWAYQDANTIIKKLTESGVEILKES